MNMLWRPDSSREPRGDQGYGHRGDVKRLFSASVSGLTRQGASVSYLSAHDPGWPRQCVYDEFVSHRYRCEPGTPAYDVEGETQTCRLSNLFLEPAGGA
jgi:hypothetical protein